MAKTYRDLMAEARHVVPEWTPDDVRQRASNGGGYTLIDVREKEEYREGHLPGAVSVPRGFLDMRIEETVPDKNTPLVLYCAGGTRSLLAGRSRHFARKMPRRIITGRLRMVRGRALSSIRGGSRR